MVALAGGLAALGVLAIAALALASGSATASALADRGGGGCSLASVPVSDSNVADLRKSIRCLINQQRAIHGFGRLVRNAPLQKAAQRHTATMVATGCLAHRCPGEEDLDSRLLHAGYFDGAQSWRYAEDTGCGLTAQAMVASWMASRFHRINLLDPDYKDIGVGVSQQRVPGLCESGYGTFAVVFGDRTP